MRKLPSPLLVSLSLPALAASIAFAPTVVARSKPSPPPANQCWTVEGPHGSGSEVYFNAENNCAEPRHCRVWINWHEPPVQVHLDQGTKGRIDVGKTEPTDKFSYDCVPVSPGM